MDNRRTAHDSKLWNAALCPSNAREPGPGGPNNSPAPDPAYADEQMRISSFDETWDGKRKPAPPDMARAGFYLCTAMSLDHTICYSCGLVLHEWKKVDSPLAEHEMYNDELEQDCDHVTNVRAAEAAAQHEQGAAAPQQ